MDRRTTHVFEKGINRRVDIERTDDPNRLYTLQNARLYKRGETGYVSRIKGYQEISTRFIVNPLDIINFRDDYIVVLDRLSTNHRVSIFERATGNVVFTGYYTADISNDGKLLVQEDTIFIAPHNKQLNRYDGEWVLNDFESTTPLFNAGSFPREYIAQVAGSSNSFGSVEFNIPIQVSGSSNSFGQTQTQT